MARPKVLDDSKRDMICALATAGMRMQGIAEYVGCSVQTITRERRQNEEFEERFRRARAASDLKPLEAMRRASATHWRAAAWMLERSDRRFEERRTQHTTGVAPHKVSAMCDAVLGTLRSKLREYPVELFRLEQDVRQVFRGALASSNCSTRKFDRQHDAELLQAIDDFSKQLAEQEERWRQEEGDLEEPPEEGFDSFGAQGAPKLEGFCPPSPEKQLVKKGKMKSRGTKTSRVLDAKLRSRRGAPKRPKLSG